jgi:uncharacterized protein (TIGR00251 family)
LPRITITVSPGAARTELVGRHGDGWKARIAAPPDRGRANEALVELLAETLGLARDRIQLSTGHTSRRKVIVIEVEGLDAEEIGRRLEAPARSS